MLLMNSTLDFPLVVTQDPSSTLTAPPATKALFLLNVIVEFIAKVMYDCLAYMAPPTHDTLFITKVTAEFPLAIILD